MPQTRKRPCRICLRWFYPDPRVGDRQRSCADPDCQTARRQKTQAAWPTQNPSYAASYRIDQRHSDPSSDLEPLRLPPPLNLLPWDLAKDQFTSKAVDFIALLSALLLRAAKDQSSSYPIDPKGVPNNNPTPSQKTSSPSTHTETQATPPHAPSPGISSTGPPPGASPDPPPSPLPAAPRLPG